MTNCDWKPVQKAFPLEQIAFRAGIVLRPLEASDLDALCLFMTGDAEMTWPRKPWSRGNVEYLLSLRFKHYSDYGFGPYAIVKNGNVIGMAGAQVWEYAECGIEVLAYVARPYWSTGLAPRVLMWTLMRARHVAGLKYVYAAVRPENERAIRLTQRLGFEETSRGEHYGYPAKFLRLDLQKLPDRYLRLGCAEPPNDC